MKNEKIANALNEIDDHYLAQAAKPKARKSYWIAAVAAVLVLVITISLMPGQHQNPAGPNLEDPFTNSTANDFEHNAPIPEDGAIDLSAVLQLRDLQAAPSFPTMTQKPNRDDFSDWKEYNAAESAWYNEQMAFYNQPDGYADSLTAFFRRSIKEFLSGKENGAYSPVNVYLAMAMLAETTDGNSRQQILDMFGVSTIEELRIQASHLWNAHYCNDGQTTLLLANSLWLTQRYSFHRDTVDRLANDYYASVFSGNLGTDESNAQLQTWLNAMTGGLLEEQSKDTKLSENAVFALVSTIYFKAGWMEEFSKEQTTEDIFHSPSGDITTAFMHNSRDGIYFRGSNFGAIRLDLTGNNGMWIILPDEGVTVAEVLAGEEYLNMTLDPNAWENKSIGIIKLSLPKFDVTSQSDLIKGMKNLGLSDIFDPNLSDFSPMTSDNDRLFVSQMDHAARVVIDEEGVIAAAYTVIEVSDEAMPPSTIIEFTVDRPFAFIVSSRDNLPMFAGVVTEP